MYTYSSSHFRMMMSYDVTGGGPMEVPIVEFQYTSTQITLIQSHYFSSEDIHKNVKIESSTLFGCCTVHVNDVVTDWSYILSSDSCFYAFICNSILLTVAITYNNTSSPLLIVFE